MPTSDGLLLIDDLSVRYGRVEALRGASLRVEQGEIMALLGANGAGKTTLLRSVSGLVGAASGTVTFHGRPITGLRADKVTRAGIAHVPEGRRVVAPLTVEENLLLAGRAARRSSAAQLTDLRDDVYDLFTRLRDRRQQVSGSLSGGEQQMLAIARALMTRPDLLLLDEPSMGLAPIVIEEIYDILAARTGGLAETAILLAEQSTTIALELASSACLLSRGQVVYLGPAADVTEELTVAAYLGGPPPSTPPRGRTEVR